MYLDVKVRLLNKFWAGYLVDSRETGSDPVRHRADKYLGSRLLGSASKGFFVRWSNVGWTLHIGPRIRTGRCS
jgi:hypothetical protein